MKSLNMISSTGRIPPIAAPTAAAVIPCSAIAVSRTRSAPNSANSPWVTLNTPPGAPISYPIRKTRSSSLIASRRADRMASAKLTVRDSLVVSTDVDKFLDLLGIRKRTFASKLKSGLNFGCTCGSYVLDLRVLDPAKLEIANGSLQRIALPPELNLLPRSVRHRRSIANVMSREPIRLELQKRRTMAITGPCHGACRRVANLADVHAVNTSRGYPHRFRPSTQSRSRGDTPRRRVLTVLIVLTCKHERQRPQRGHVHRFIRDALVDRTVPTESCNHTPFTLHFARQRHPTGEADTGSDNPHGADIAMSNIGEVHCPAASPTHAICLAQHLGHQRVHTRALRDAVTMAPMGGDDVVILFQGATHARSHCFLPDREMSEARHLAAPVDLPHRVLEPADRGHLRERS